METASLNHKICTKCLIEQNIEQFPIHKNYKGGRTTWCRQCLKKQSTQWHQDNRDRSREIDRNSYRKNPDKRRDSKFKSRYGITLDDFNRLSKSQDHECAICRKHGSENKNGHLFVDHSHSTGKVRGLLCDNCNKALGNFGDDLETVRNAVRYLEKYGIL